MEIKEGAIQRMGECHCGALKVIAAGGVASLDDIRRLRGEKGIEGVIVGRALYSGALSLSEAIEVGRGSDAG